MEGLPSHAAGEGQRAGDPRSAGLSVGVGLVRTRGLLLRTGGHTCPGTCASCGTLGFPVGSDPLLRKQGGDQRPVWGPRGLGLGGQTP